MVAHVWGVVARRAGADNDGPAEDVVEAANACDADRLAVEDRLAPRDRRSRGGIAVGRGALEARPYVVERERVRGERRSRRVEPQRVVDANEEVLVGQVQRTATASLRVQLAGRVIASLRAEESGFEGDDLLELPGTGRDGGLGVAERGVQGLVHQVGLESLRVGVCDRLYRLTAIPHYGTQERQVRRRQRAAEQRQVIGSRIVIRVIDGCDGELSARRRAQG